MNCANKGRARITLRVLTLDDLEPEDRSYSVRVTLPAKDVSTLEIGETIALHVTLQPPPEPIEPGARFRAPSLVARLGGTGYATSNVEPLIAAPPPPWNLLGLEADRRLARQGQCPQTTVSIIGCSRTARRGRRHPARPPSAATARAASARSKARPLRSFVRSERSKRIAASPISSSHPLPSARDTAPARVIVDRRVLKAEGAHALYIEGLPIRTETVAAWRGHRPWFPDRASVRSTPNSRLEPFVDEGADAADRGNSGNPEE